MNERERMLKTVQIAHFALMELGLYLDTHPNDKNAQQNFKKFQELMSQAVKAYTEKYGPLTPADYNGGTWQWIDSPWPWEMER